MKNTLPLIASILMCISFLSYGQEARVVVIDGWDPTTGGDAEDNKNLFSTAVIADSTGRMENPNTIYELRRGHLYPEGATVRNFGYHLHVRAEEGDGLQPEFTPALRSNGSYGAQYIRANGDLTIENITFNAFRPDGAFLVRPVRMDANSTTSVLDGMITYGDRGAGYSFYGDSLKVFMRNCIVANSGHRKSFGGNGRVIDMRPQAVFVDTLVIENTTAYNLSDRVIRNMGSVVNYIKIDHLTVMNTKGFHGGVQLGNVKTAIVKNSLFHNVISMGHADYRTNEQTQPDEFFAVITLDTVFDGQSIEVKNNNIYWTDPIIDTWAKFDSVSSPNIYSATVAEAVGEENVDAIAISEELELNNVCGDISAYVDAFYATPDAAEFPENWCVGGEGGVFPDEVDASYADTYTSYTGGDDNFPIGDLNHFPDFLKAWSGPVIADLDNIVLESSGDSQNVSLSVTDARGLDVSITVSSSDESVATATYDNGEILVTAVANMGIATITVAASNGEVTTEENFIVSVGGVLSVEDELESNLLVYPNPTKGFTTFRYNMDKNDEMMVTLLDMNGRRLGILDSGTKTKGQHELKVDLGQYISNYGVYFAKFQTSDESNIMRLIYINK